MSGLDDDEKAVLDATDIKERLDLLVRGGANVRRRGNVTSEVFSTLRVEALLSVETASHVDSNVASGPKDNALIMEEDTE